jgi:hypothetical protein
MGGKFKEDRQVTSLSISASGTTKELQLIKLHLK